MLEVKMVDKILNENNLKKDTYKLIANLDTIKDLGMTIWEYIESNHSN